MVNWSDDVSEEERRKLGGHFGGMASAVSCQPGLYLLVTRCEGDAFRVIGHSDGLPAPLDSAWGDSLGQVLACSTENSADVSEDEQHDAMALCRDSQMQSNKIEEFSSDTASLWLASSLSPIIDRRGVVSHIVEVVVDRTSEHEFAGRQDDMRKRAEVVAQLEVVGRLAAGIAHDFNNVLTAIIGNTALLRVAMMNQGSLTPRTEHIVDEVELASDRAAALVRQLLTFTEQRETTPDPWRIDELMESCTRILTRVLPEAVAVRVEEHVDGAIEIDRGLFEQALVNLSVNAADAMPRGGTLTLRTLSGPGTVSIEVCDTGEGMSQETQDRMFEPFFTTKPVGKGTGLGMANVKRTIEQAGGVILVNSVKNVGTTITLSFPSVAYRPDVSDSCESLPAGRARGTILLCEDDLIVRTSIASMLEQAGYSVQSADGPDEALRRLASTNMTFDLLVTDVIMPGMNGVAFARQVRLKQPDTPVLFISGYSHDVLVEQGVSEREIDLLQKPFSYETLLRRVRSAMTSPPRARPHTTGQHTNVLGY
ncbi:MAG: two-component system cell cycle sensor histidine kinase/response regulator CckA [Bradymonadia bacterium]|jgi:two-component system cell cycle sensor histidine kinase/response regulator CckA